MFVIVKTKTTHFSKFASNKINPVQLRLLAPSRSHSAKPLNYMKAAHLIFCLGMIIVNMCFFKYVEIVTFKTYIMNNKYKTDAKKKRNVYL